MLISRSHIFILYIHRDIVHLVDFKVSHIYLICTDRQSTPCRFQGSAYLSFINREITYIYCVYTDVYKSMLYIQKTDLSCIYREMQHTVIHWNTLLYLSVLYKQRDNLYLLCIYTDTSIYLVYTEDIFVLCIQRDAAHCNTLKHTAIFNYRVSQRTYSSCIYREMQHTVIHWNTLLYLFIVYTQRTYSSCIYREMQHTVIDSNTLLYPSFLYIQTTNILYIQRDNLSLADICI